MYTSCARLCCDPYMVSGLAKGVHRQDPLGEKGDKRVLRIPLKHVAEFQGIRWDLFAYRLCFV